jgi:hypothetical protein
MSRPKNCPTWNPNAFILFSAQNDIADMNTRSYFDRPRERRDLHRDAAPPEPLVNTWSLDVDRNPKIRRNAEFFRPDSRLGGIGGGVLHSRQRYVPVQVSREIRGWREAGRFHAARSLVDCGLHLQFSCFQCKRSTSRKSP